MLKYAELSKGQKRFVDSTISIRPKFINGGSITLKECSEVFHELYATRTGAKGGKVGFPNWLMATNKVSRGVYQFPAPIKKSGKKITSVILDSGDEFNDELRANGIEV